jgi:adenosylmethionine-8-amino-7-oxononanoate aminotransferase
VLLRPLGSVLYAMPPLGISPESLERMVAAMSRAVGDANPKT